MRYEFDNEVRCARCGISADDLYAALKVNAEGKIVCRYFVQCERRAERARAILYRIAQAGQTPQERDAARRMLRDRRFGV